jgi:hypothetical protein
VTLSASADSVAIRLTRGRRVVALGSTRARARQISVPLRVSRALGAKRYTATVVVRHRRLVRVVRFSVRVS